MTKQKKLKKWRRAFTGGSIGATGVGVDTALVQTDGSFLHALVVLIDNKGAFFDPVSQEAPGRLVESVKAVRTLAVATQSSVESVEADEIAFGIADACRVFMRDFDESMDDAVWQGVLIGLRREVERQVGLAVVAFRVPTPRNLDLKAQYESVQGMFQRWQLDDPS